MTLRKLSFLSAVCLLFMASRASAQDSAVSFNLASGIISATRSGGDQTLTLNQPLKLTEPIIIGQYTDLQDEFGYPLLYCNPNTGLWEMRTDYLTVTTEFSVSYGSFTRLSTSSATSGNLALTPHAGTWYTGTDDPATYTAAVNGAVDYSSDTRRLYYFNGTGWMQVATSADIAGSVAGVSSVNTRTGAVTLTKSDVGLPNVPNVDATNADNLASGTLPDARLAASVPLLADYGSGSSIDLNVNGAILQGGNLVAYEGSLYFGNGYQFTQSDGAFGNYYFNVYSDGTIAGPGFEIDPNGQFTNNGGGIGADGTLYASSVQVNGNFVTDGTALGPLDGSALTGNATNLSVNYAVTSENAYSGANTFDNFFTGFMPDVSLPGDGTASFAYGNFQIDGNGELIAANVATGNGYSFSDGTSFSGEGENFVALNGGSGSVNLSVNGSLYVSDLFSTDYGRISSDGNGNLNVAANMTANTYGFVEFGQPKGYIISDGTYLYYVDASGTKHTLSMTP